MRAVLVACLALPGAACDARHDAGSQAQTAAAKLQAIPLPTMERQLEIVHRGVRRVELFAGGSSPVLVFREEVVVGGDGRFGLEPLEAFSPVPDDWIHRERLWARFSFRYRDFAIRDSDSFLRNWRLTDLGQETVVAGRKCSSYLVERKIGEAKRYELALDEELGCILREAKYDAEGRLLSVVEYESLDPQPDLESAVWTQGAVDERELDPAADLRSQLGAALSLPRRIPEGFELREASTARFLDRDWLRLVYDDGVESVFFLSTLPGSGAPAGSEGASASSRGPGSSPDRLLSARLGAINVVQALTGEGLLMGIGAIGERELADLVESALP